MNEKENSAFHHDPVRPPRATFVGESVFAYRWAQQMRHLRKNWLDESLYEPLESVLHDHTGPTDQRAATVAASFITWLGTNCGRAYLAQARQFSQAMKISLPNAYVAALALEMRRQRGVNHWSSLVEGLLTRDAPDQSSPALCVTDLEIIPHVAAWLGEHEGQTFLNECIANVDRIYARWRAMHASAVGGAAAELLLGDLIQADAKEFAQQQAEALA